jgi:hypothetical protein
MELYCRLSSEGQQRRINTKKGPLVHQKQLRKKKCRETLRNQNAVIMDPAPHMLHEFILYLIAGSYYLQSLIGWRGGQRGGIGQQPSNFYTGQNPRQHVVLQNTSQMCTICTQSGHNRSACFTLTSASLLGTWGRYVSVDIYIYSTYIKVHQMVCGLVTRFIITAFICDKI